LFAYKKDGLLFPFLLFILKGNMICSNWFTFQVGKCPSFSITHSICPVHYYKSKVCLFSFYFLLTNQNQPNKYLVGSLKENKLIKLHKVSNLKILKCIISW